MTRRGGRGQPASTTNQPEGGRRFLLHELTETADLLHTVAGGIGEETPAGRLRLTGHLLQWTVRLHRRQVGLATSGVVSRSANRRATADGTGIVAISA